MDCDENFFMARNHRRSQAGNRDHNLDAIALQPTLHKIRQSSHNEAGVIEVEIGFSSCFMSHNDRCQRSVLMPTGQGHSI